MKLKVQKVETWAAPIEDKPGALASSLAALAKAGADLEFVIARRAPDKPRTGVVFLSPVKGAGAVRVAKEKGFRKTEHLHGVRIEGTNRPGQGAAMVQALADGGLNLRGFSAAALGSKFVAFAGLDTDADASRAVKLLRAL
jgi:hypothetical protein